MFRTIRWTLIALSLVWAGACRPASPAIELTPSISTIVPSAEGSAPASATPGSTDGTAGAEKALEEAELEALVRAALAESLGAAADEIETLAASTAVWPDRGLGCSVRRGLFPPEATPGYRFVLGYEGNRYEFHTDEFGEFVRCPEVGKSFDPIQ